MAGRRGADRVSPRDRRARVNLVLAWILVANLVVVAAKLAAGLHSGSMAVLGIAADSGLDAFNNVVALMAVWIAAAPADAEHPYGHGKFETLGALAIVSFLSITCFEVARSAIGRLLSGAPPPHLEAATFWVLGGTMAVNVAVTLTEQRMGRKLDSEILQADARHTGADVLITAAVLGGLALVARGWTQGDAWLALVVVVLIAYSGYQILRDTVPILVDRRAVHPDRIRALVTREDGVRHASGIRSRGRPGEAFAELTIHVDPAAGVREAHEVADRVERLLEEEGGFSGVTVHVEPAAEPADRADAGGGSRDRG